jgi:histidinol-phosphate aminotransferase
MKNSPPKKPTPSANLHGLAPYVVPLAPAPTDLKLDSNEGACAPFDAAARLAELAALPICRYIKPRALEEQFAQRLSIDPARVIATAGADEAIDRACRVFVQPDREVVIPSPTFEMIVTFARLSGGQIRRVPWVTGPFPTDAMIAAVTPQTGMIVVVTPNNPTGAVVPTAALRELSAAAPHALFLVDLAYAPFADEDATQAVLELPNAIAVHTMSKAWGLAGLRVGFAAGPAEIIHHLRVTAGPFPISNLSQTLAAWWLRDGGPWHRTYVAAVRDEREKLRYRLNELGAAALPSQTNFVFACFADALWVRDAMAGFGIAVRYVPDDNGFGPGLRITCPGDAGLFARVEHAFRTILAPQALLLGANVADAALDELKRVGGPLSIAVFRRDKEDVRSALARLGVERAWLISDAPDDLRAAKDAGVLPLGFLAPSAPAAETVAALHQAGGARVFRRLEELAALLPAS